MENIERLRNEIRTHVISVNKHLKDVLPTMSDIDMVANSHPMYRTDYLRRFYKLGFISADDVGFKFKTAL